MIYYQFPEAIIHCSQNNSSGFYAFNINCTEKMGQICLSVRHIRNTKFN